MKFHTVMIAAFVPLLLINAAYTQAAKDKKHTGPKTPLGIVNGMASYLPTPPYPQSAKDFCARGKVEVEVLIGHDGKVISANALSGDELLLETSITAAKQAIFTSRIDGPPVRQRGKLVYNFEGVKRCIPAGVANDKSLERPTAIPDHSFTLTKPVKVTVRILVDGQGKVLRVLADGNIDPAIKAMAEKLALETKFTQLPHGPMDIFVSASLVFIFKPGGKVEY